MKQILITGVAGFIGSHVARRFLEEGGYRIIGIDDLSVGRLENVPPGVEFIQGDLAAASTVAALPGCRKILHLAGQSSGEISFDNPVADLRMNTVATLNLIRYGIDHGVECLVYASSMSVYGAVEDAPTTETHECRPLSCYGVGKLASEGYLRVYRNRLPSVSLRMFNVYGPGQDMSNLRQGMVSIYMAQALARGRIEVRGSLDRFRDFIFIDDVTEAWFRAATRAAALGATLNIATGVRTTVAELLDRICTLVPGCSYHTTGGTPGDQSGIYADVTASSAALGLERFTPLSFGLPGFLAWARAAAAANSRTSPA